MDVTGENGQIFVFIHENALVPSLVEMSDPFVTSIVIAGIGYIKLAHEFRKVSEGRFDQEVKMVYHEDIGVQLDGIDVQGLSEYLEKTSSISIVFEDCLPFIPTTGDVVDSVGVLDSKRPGHAVTVAGKSLFVNIEDLTPFCSYT